VSNLAPPEGVRIRSVVREKPASAADIAAREAHRRAELTALEEQVRNLQAQVEAARQPRVAEQPAAAPVVYNIITVSPPPMPDFAAAPVAYADTTPAAAYGCVPSWAGCATWWPGFATSTVVVSSPRIRRFGGFGPEHRFRSPPRTRGAFDFPTSLPATTGGMPTRR
jgi:hypothetical protein